MINNKNGENYIYPVHMENKLKLAIWTKNEKGKSIWGLIEIEDFEKMISRFNKEIKPLMRKEVAVMGDK